MRRLLVLLASLGLWACGGKAIAGADSEGVGGWGGRTGAGGRHGDGTGAVGSGGYVTGVGGSPVGAGGAIGTGGVFGVGGSAGGTGGGTSMYPPCSEGPVAGSACRLAWGGVNLAGAEFGEALPGVYNVDYTYPGSADVSYFAKKGMTIIRLPFKWERLQWNPNAALDVDELARLKAAVSAATERGMTVIVDPHNYARYRVAGDDRLIGDGIVIPEHLADFWSKLATELKDEPRVVFGLMNEPHDIDTALWVHTANLAISAIRSAGATQLILVPGTHWTGAHSWTTSQNGTYMLDVLDPGNNYAYEAHQYLDSNYSGSSEKCTVLDANAVLENFTSWLRVNGKRGFLGEFGGGSGDDCKAALTSVLNHLERNADVWLGWTYWAGGPWWGDYFTSISPTATGEDKPQMTWLMPHLP